MLFCRTGGVLSPHCYRLDLLTAGDANLVQMAECHRIVHVHGVTEILDASPLSLP